MATIPQQVAALATRVGQEIKRGLWRGDYEVYDRAADHAAGAATGIAATGQTPILAGYTNVNNDATAYPKYNGTRLITDATSTSGLGSFIQYNLGKPVTYQKASWVWTTTGTANTGAIGFITWNPGFNGNPVTPPESSCHLSIYPTGYQFAIVYGGSFLVSQSGTFATPLAQDGVTVHTAEVVHDMAGGAETIYLYAPDGTVRKMPAYQGGVYTATTTAAFEIYKGANGDKNVEIIDWAADSRRNRGIRARTDYAALNPYATEYTGNNNPPAPPTGVLAFARDKGRKNLATIDSTGYIAEIQPSMYSTKIGRLNAVNGSATPSVDGLAPTWTVASTAVSNAATNFYTSIVRTRSTSAATAGSGCGVRTNVGFFLSSTANMGGFYFVARIGLATVTATNRGFVGLAVTGGALSPTVEPSTLLNQFGFAFDSTETTWRFTTNDGSGTATKVDLGANFPVRAATDFYDFRLYAPPGGGSLVYWNAVRLNDGAVASGSVTTKLPALGTLLAAQVHHSNGTTAASVACDVSSLYIETDN